MNVIRLSAKLAFQSGILSSVQHSGVILCVVIGILGSSGCKNTEVGVRSSFRPSAKISEPEVSYDLNNFLYDDVLGWASHFRSQEFDRFSYDGLGWDNSSPPRNYRITIDADSEEDAPSDGALSLARSLLEDLPKLSRLARISILDDLHGRGPGSGIWWNGDIETVYEVSDKHLPRLDLPDTLFEWLRPASIRIRKKAIGYDRVVAEVVFFAAFDKEHDIGILTDGDSIIGIDYGHDVGAFAPSNP